MAGLTFKPMDFQMAFYGSTSPYPARIAPWGDGKTTCAIMKGLILSELYPGNEGLIIRRRFNALQRSTIRDFTAWTKINVPDQKQTITLKGSNSRINFSHCDNIVDFREAIQGMNLGWAYIEQGDELEDASIFDELKGRLRRILTPNREVQESLVALGVISEPIEDFRNLTVERREEIERVSIEKLHPPVRQIFVIANAMGHNWMYKRWHPNCRPLEGYDLSIGAPFENKQYIPKSTLAGWEQLRAENPKKYARYVMNSFEDYDIEGSFYASLMSDALKEKRVEVLDMYDGTVPVYTFWDLGVGNATAIWFVQFVGQSIHLIDYYANTGQGMEFYSGVLDQRKYKYQEHWLPHDARQRLQGQTITTRLDILRRLRPREDVYVVPKHSVEDRIQAVRSILDKCRFSLSCEKGVECLNRYHREVNKLRTTDEKTVFLDTPAKEFSDGADAFGYLAVSYRYFLTDKQTRRTMGGAEAELPDSELFKEEEQYDPLSHLTKKGNRYSMAGKRR